MTERFGTLLSIFPRPFQRSVCFLLILYLSHAPKRKRSDPLVPRQSGGNRWTVPDKSNNGVLLIDFD